MQIFSAGRDGTNEPTEGSTRGPRGPKNILYRQIQVRVKNTTKIKKF